MRIRSYIRPLPITAGMQRREGGENHEPSVLG